MGCVAMQKIPDNTFKVKNINDSRRSVQTGLMEVTAADLLYTDSKTQEQWQWPLKFLRKYGCDGDVFSFEAGRKCPGGEGLYAFSTPRASLLFDLVARNINLGDLQPSGDLSPLPSEVRPPDQSTINFNRRSTTTSLPSPPLPLTPGADLQQPNYQNMDVTGRHLVIDVSAVGEAAAAGPGGSPAPNPDSPPSVTEPRKFPYHEVVFDKEPAEHPPPSADPEQRTSYIKIDFNQTQRYNVERRNGTLPYQHPLPPTTTLPPAAAAHHHHNHSSSSVSSSSHHRHPTRLSTSSMTEPTRPGRPRLHTVPSSTSKGSLSGGSSVSSQSSLTESLRDHTRSPRGGNSGGSLLMPTPEQHITYQNLLLGQSGPQMPPLMQPNYQNVHVGSGSVASVTSPPGSGGSSNGVQQQANYLNVTCSAANGLVVHGEPTAHYANLDLSSHRTSTPRQTSYMQLDFNQSAVANGHSGTSTPVAAAPVTRDRYSPEATTVDVTASMQVNGDKPPAPKTGEDPTTVNYGVLDFGAMEAIKTLSHQREQEHLEKERETERRKEKEKEKSSTHRRHK